MNLLDRYANMTASCISFFQPCTLLHLQDILGMFFIAKIDYLVIFGYLLLGGLP